MTESLSAEEIAELRTAMSRAAYARNDLMLTTDEVLHWQSRYRYAIEDAAPALLAMASRLVELERNEYSKQRAVRTELLSVIAAQANLSSMGAVTSEWLAAFAPELVSGEFSKIGWPGPTTPTKGSE